MKPCKYKQTLEIIFASLGVVPEKEWKFHPERRWRLDYAFPELKIAVEYEGMAFRGGKSRHTTIGGFSRDCEKYNELSLAGWTLLRFNAKTVQSGMAHGQIERIINDRHQRKP